VPSTLHPRTRARGGYWLGTLVVRGAHGIGREQTQLDLSETVLGVKLPNLESVGVQVAQQRNEKFVDLQQCLRAVGRTAVSRPQLVAVVPHEELELVAHPEL